MDSDHKPPKPEMSSSDLVGTQNNVLRPKTLFQCGKDKCKRSFDSKQGLSLHQQSCGVVKGRFPCKYEGCPFIAKSTGGKSNHERKCNHGKTNNMCNKTVNVSGDQESTTGSQIHAGSHLAITNQNYIVHTHLTNYRDTSFPTSTTYPPPSTPKSPFSFSDSDSFEHYDTGMQHQQFTSQAAHLTDCSSSSRNIIFPEPGPEISFDPIYSNGDSAPSTIMMTNTPCKSAKISNEVKNSTPRRDSGPPPVLFQDSVEDVPLSPISEFIREARESSDPVSKFIKEAKEKSLATPCPTASAMEQRQWLAPVQGKDISEDVRVNKILDWETVQQNFDYLKDESVADFEIKMKLNIKPQSIKAETWEEIDEKFEQKFAMSPAEDKRDNQRHLEIFKESVYNVVEEAVGCVEQANTNKLKKRHSYIDEQKKKIRKEKNDARREFKKMMREETGVSQDIIEQKAVQWKKLIRLHNKLRKQEMSANERLQRKENTRQFCKNPYQFIKDNLTKKQSQSIISAPNCSADDATSFFGERYSDSGRKDMLSFPEFLDIPSLPKSGFRGKAPSDEDIYEYLKSRRNKSAPGPDGIPFIIYKRCKNIRKALSVIIRRVFAESTIPQIECVAVKVLLHKGGNAELSNFRDITLFNTSLKVMTGVWARRVRSFMMKNSYFNTNIQKGFLPKISGCVEHNQTVIDIVKEKMAADKDAYILWLDLENAFGNVKHNLMFAALKWYNVPDKAIDFIKTLYNNCSVKVVSEEWTTKPFRVEKGSLQGGPEAGLLFNISWNLGLELLLYVAITLGCNEEDKPVTGFADDLTISTEDRDAMIQLVKAAEQFCKWAKLNFKDSKCKSFGLHNSSMVNPLIPVNGRIVPTMHKEPHKFLGRLVYPKLAKVEEHDVVKRFKELMEMTDKLLLDNRKKAWIYENGVLKAMSWEFMIYKYSQTSIDEMEAVTTRLLKKWFGLCKSADPSILFRKEKGLNIKTVGNSVTKAQVNKEVILSCSRDVVVRRTSYRRRMEGMNKEGDQSVAAKMDEAVQRATHACMFKGQNNRQGLGHGTYRHYEVSRKHIAAEINNMAQEQMIPHILSLAIQSKWKEWDNVIDLDLKWKEVLYAISPSTLKFILNSIQDTLPDPANLRRWSAVVEPACGLCGWKNVGHVHILCGCKVALEQGRVSFRHDSILKIISQALTEKIKIAATTEKRKSVSIEFVRKGARKKKDEEKAKPPSILDSSHDWVIQVDYKKHQTPFPASIYLTEERPDIVVYSESSKQVILIELTCPAEENIEKWRERKLTKYEELAAKIKESSQWKPHVFTIEVGARGFVCKRTNAILSRFGCSAKEIQKLTKDMSRMAIRCSHFIWICRDIKTWTTPEM